MRKKRVIFHSNSPTSKTGFGRNLKPLLKYLYKTGKYELIEYSSANQWDSKALENRPWKAFGTLPTDLNEWNEISKNEALAKIVNYGAKYIDKLIYQEKPDVYIGIEDIWAFNGFWDKEWWNKTNCIIHSTLDSIPISKTATENANKIENFYVWADFAEREMKNLGFNHVKTLHGVIDCDSFYRLSDLERKKIRKNNGIDENAFIIGFVFRNQLRKSVPQLLEAFSEFSKKHDNAYLLLHTCWSEKPESSWDIKEYIIKNNIDNNKILTTYICPKCLNYKVRPFIGENIDCDICGSKKNVNTTSTLFGTTESQLNEIYNLMDVYCHPFTSGGQEMPIQEAKLTEIPTLVTNYSCGEEYCLNENGGLKLDWSSYYEPYSNFIKATTIPSSIVYNLEKVYKWSNDKRKSFGKKGRDFVLKNFRIEVIGKQWEDIIDKLPYIVESEEEALKENIKNYKIFDFKKPIDNNLTLTDLLKSEDDDKKRLAIVIPESAGDCLFITSLLDNVKEVYPEYNIFIITKEEYFEIFSGNPNVHRVLPYIKICDNLLWLEGNGNRKGLFDIAFLPHVGTQLVLNYLHNGEDRIQFDIKDNK